MSAENPLAADDLKRAADQAMRAGDLVRARRLFERAVEVDPSRLEVWLGLAACRRASQDPNAALAAIEGALRLDPRCFPALLMKGALVEATAGVKAANSFYKAALAVAPPRETMNEATLRALAHAERSTETLAADLADHLKAAAGISSADARSVEDRRLEAFIEATAGRRKIYHQEPVQFHYPGLPAIEFHERECFPWLAAFEARTDAIRTELLSVWSDGSPGLSPYVNYPDGMPLDQWAALNRSMDWTAFHLLLDGAPVEGNCRRCPETMAALTLVDQPRTPGRSPAAMFSILKPRTHIPPHTGVSNTRLVLHLPLIVPEGCGFRVGGETRLWREGEAFVFDDTIEHEAWNDSDQPRAVLICDVWSPALFDGERSRIAQVMGALDRFSAEPATR